MHCGMPVCLYVSNDMWLKIVLLIVAFVGFFGSIYLLY